MIKNNVFNYFVNNKINGYIYIVKVNDENIKELNSSIMYLKQKGYKILSLDDILKE